jgi:hypothetical protein
MRDIRDDLQERAKFCEAQIRAICSQFDHVVQQMQSERDARIADLKSGLAMIQKLMEFEHQLIGKVVPLPKTSTPPRSLVERIRTANAR